MFQRSNWLKCAVAQGITVPVVYAAAAFLGGLLHPGYNHMSQAVSELSAAGAPNQHWLLGAFTVAEILTFVFGIGFYLCVRMTNTMLSASALIIAAIGLIGIGFALFPMDQVGSPMTFDGEMHIVIVAISALLAIIAVLLSGLGWKRLPGGAGLAKFSFVMLGTMVASGMIAGFAATNEWPGIGAWQRVNIGAFSLWQIGTSIHLLRQA